MPKNLEKAKNSTNISEKEWEKVEEDHELRFVKVVQELKDKSYDMLEDINEIPSELKKVNLSKSASTIDNKPILPKM